DKNILCAIEAKSNNIEHEFCQNLVQLKNACEKNRKRKHGGLDHVYRAVTTGEKWGFTVVTADNQIGAVHEPLIVHLSDANIVDDVLKEDVRSLFSVLRAIILERLKEPKTKIQRIK
ncbi:44542_t:CDS:2, partial [Gigaspora margarita]